MIPKHVVRLRVRRKNILIAISKLFFHIIRDIGAIFEFKFAAIIKVWSQVLCRTILSIKFNAAGTICLLGLVHDDAWRAN